MPKSMQSSRLSIEAQLDLPDPAMRRGRKHASVLLIPSVLGRGPQPRGCAGRGSTKWRWTDPPDNSDTPDLSASMAG